MSLVDIRRLGIAIEGRGVYTKASKAKNNDVFISYHPTLTISVPDTAEMLVAEAYSLRYKRLKNLEFSIKNT